MEKFIVEINNNSALNILKSLEDLKIIKVLKRISYPAAVTANDDEKRNARLLEIRSITKDIHVDLSNFHFNREEANNYDA